MWSNVCNPGNNNNSFIFASLFKWLDAFEIVCDWVIFQKSVIRAAITMKAMATAREVHHNSKDNEVNKFFKVGVQAKGQFPYPGLCLGFTAILT